MIGRLEVCTRGNRLAARCQTVGRLCSTGRDGMIDLGDNWGVLRYMCFVSAVLWS